MQKIFIAIENQVPYKKPILITKDPNRCDHTKYCRYHKDHGHETNEYHQLKDGIEYLVKMGHMIRYVNHREDQNDNQNDGRQRQQSPPNRPQSPAYISEVPYVIAIVVTICGGTHFIGENSKCRERYARELCHQTYEVMIDEERPNKVSRMEDQDIAFTSEDSIYVTYPHNDPMVIEAQIAILNVLRVLVDNDSSINILYKSCLDKMNLSVRDLAPCSTTIYGFNGEGLDPIRSIKFPVTLGDPLRRENCMAMFLVVNCMSVYNVMLGQPVLIDLRAITSIWHLTIKFPTGKGISCIRGNQREARECYNVSINKAKKGRLLAQK
ncbi:uncharacterized protein LOC133792395 [Humulus lupulus]|uniref:uncharacterized protein LOC133792395 n=1 Tax=Humulus lupulus TaxID=3486 RepID=UPI002B40C2D2|nr:uncharacterized protein LOC133792395 [Humulus lupulus]